MQHIPCLNYCEILSQMGETKEEFEKSLSRSLQMAGFSYCTRLYIGSYFCSRYFLSITREQFEVVEAVCKEKKIKITLVLPIFTQQDLASGKEKIKQYAKRFGSLIDEVTINDFGMLDYMYTEYTKKDESVHLMLGRLLMKDSRDPRYEEHFKCPLRPKIVTEYLDDLRFKYGLKGIELDPTHEMIDLEQCPEELEVCIHAPYCYVTVGQICEFSSIPKQIEKKFRPNVACNLECRDHMIHYIMEGEHMWLRFGRGIFFENRDVKIRGVHSIRLNYFPVEWEGKHEGTCSTESY